MDGHDAFISKISYVAAGAGLAKTGKIAVKRLRKGKLQRLADTHAKGQRARVADEAAKARGAAGASLESRPTVGRRRKEAWDMGFNAVGKSWNPVLGKYQKAKNLTDTHRKVIGMKAKGQSIRVKTKDGDKIVRPAGNRFKNAPSSKGRKIYEGIETKRGKLTRVVASRHQTGMHPNAAGNTQGYSLPDGRGGGKVVIHDDANFKTTAAHEMAHIKPRRNPVRLAERRKSFVVQGREEGRADFIAHGRQTTGQYPGNQMFQGGYNEVQGKMAAAKFRREKFGRKNVQKSMSPGKMQGLTRQAMKGSNLPGSKTDYAVNRLKAYTSRDDLNAARDARGRSRLVQSVHSRTKKEGRKYKALRRPLP